MRYIDVFNGDADGLIARHQFRLSFPVPYGKLTLVTGPKRDVSLLSGVDMGSVADDAVDISVFDISYDQNAQSVLRLLEAGAILRYFDHHRASQLRRHSRLITYIDTSPYLCTGLIVDRYLGGAHRPWAIAAAFGDNLTDIAKGLAAKAKMSLGQILLLQQLGECLNYNAYGESISDLHYPPEDIARRMMPYRSPFEFAHHEDIFHHLQIGFAADLRHAQGIPPLHASRVAAVYVLPDERWARRISGAFANRLVHSHTRRAHAVLSRVANGTLTVSIRAPQDNPHGADTIAIQFTHGGGRAAAAGINNLAAPDIARLVSLLEQTYRTPPASVDEN